MSGTHQSDFQPLIDSFSRPKKPDSFPAVFATLQSLGDDFAFRESGSRYSGYVWYTGPSVSLESFIPGHIQGILTGAGQPAPYLVFTVGFETLGPAIFRLASVGWPNYGKADITKTTQNFTDLNIDPLHFRFGVHDPFSANAYNIFFQMVDHPNLVVPSSIYNPHDGKPVLEKPPVVVPPVGPPGPPPGEKVRKTSA